MKKITFVVLLTMLANICHSQKLPYPIIFVHGLNSNSKTWNDMKSHLINSQLSYGGQIDFCLNYNGNNSTSNTIMYPASGADIAVYNIQPITNGDFYMINFDINNQGQLYPSEPFSPNNDVLSNEASITKQGVALKKAIEMILNITGRNKVVLMGHSMGGLASREYLQNETNWQNDGYHHVAKLATTGTPHGGFTGINFQLATFINSSSEAYRDLKKEMSTNVAGVYLYGGIESISNIGSGFYNNDINCNGVNNDGSNIVGLNQRDLFDNVDYSYIIGNCTDCVLFQGQFLGDGIVRYENANLSEFYELPWPKNEFVYTTSAITQIHSDLPKQIFQNMQALDEPNEHWLAYGIEGNNQYKGFITNQPVGGYLYDFDNYTFVLNEDSQLNLQVNTSLPNGINVRLLDSDYTQIDDIIQITST
ncbi:esterase/lipase family protein [Flavobacterium sp. PLA-1-15]|uniref:esterase/lipase family protein n=1 Tax=Flavobacterium sp. PLA-1-15 TaxID=3380533 RepID=UPI003B815086